MIADWLGVRIRSGIKLIQKSVQVRLAEEEEQFLCLRLAPYDTDIRFQNPTLKIYHIQDIERANCVVILTDRAGSNFQHGP